MHSDHPLPLAQVASQNALTFEIVVLLLALVLCALASAAETALTSVNRIRIRNLAEDGDVRAQQIERLLLKPSVFLTTILVMNNVAIILATTLATAIALSFSPQWGEVISTILVSFVTLVFCEITPKNAAVHNAEAWARALVPLVRAAAWLFQPINAFLNGITRAILRLLGIPLRRTGPSVTEEELMLLVNVGEEEGILEKDERSMIHSIFGLADTTVREIMVPRIDMVALEADTSIPQAVDIITQGGKSRIPVYDDTIDNILGVLYAKDLLRELSTNHSGQHTVRDLVRPAYFVPESKKLDDLLHELQNQRVHMALVIDEYGAVAGLVTIEDLVEEIIGDIQDEYDREEQLFEQLSSTEYIVDAKMNIDDFNEMIGVELEAGEEYDTVGGFLLSQLDKIPNVGDAVTTPEVKLTVLSTRGRRITKIKAILTHPGEYAEPPNEKSPVNPSAQPDQDEPTNMLDLSPADAVSNGVPPQPSSAVIPPGFPPDNVQGEIAPPSSAPSPASPARPLLPARMSAHQPRRRTRHR